ncbi:MAG: hydroxymethylpyrimidine/phosphomethylpyrimidine kinase [Pyrinomonadaceae bacterium]
MTKVVLTIAGLDPSGGAGIIADIKTFSAFGCFATSAVSSITFQNTVGVFGAEHQSAENVRRQVEPILEDFYISALKTGMLPTHEVIEEVARLVKENELGNFVVDPVVRSTSGFDLIDNAALKVLIKKLFPLSDLVTPNIPEAERIAGILIHSENDLEKAARIMQNFGAKNVLIKGGHLFEKNISAKAYIKDKSSKIESEVGKRKAKDFLWIGNKLHIWDGEYIETNSTHGTGCTLSAAIAANLANGKSLEESVGVAKEFVTEAIRTSPNIGKGHSPINHLLNGFDY